MTNQIRYLIALILITSLTVCGNAFAEDGAEVVSYYGYDDCIRLSNSQVSVVLCPAAGGRVLEYSLDGQNMMHLPPGDEGWTMDSDSGRGPMHAGRFDIGPEKMVKRGKVLWMGRWTGEITGARRARLTSQYDPESGARLIRDFSLDPTTSQLRCTQTIVNESEQPVSLCHWSRTFAIGGGIAVIPRSPRGRFPHGYVMYEKGNKLLFRPEDPNIRFDEDAVIVSGPPAFPKLGFDSHAGWLAYLAPNNHMFVKRFRTYPDRAYNEFAALTISVWYPQGKNVELEPIGPSEDLLPGTSASFTEHWWLLPHRFPADPAQLDFAELEQMVLKETEPPRQDTGTVVSPQVHSDHSVTFRFAGRDAAQVSVNVAGQSRAMSRRANGVWEYRSQPLEAGIHEYTFDVDGARVTDPKNRWVKKWNTCASLLEIPGEPSLLTEQQAVPHGVVHQHLYASKTTGTERAAVVYTPPGYDAGAEQPYPVVVLCHGFGDDETAWTEVGRTHHIVDNLINAGKIDPMVIVMPNGHPIPLAKRSWSEDYAARNSQAMIDDVVSDLLPLVQKHYHVTDSREQRAIVGLSMGGGHSISGGMSRGDTFAWVGAFSAAAPQGELAREHPELIAGPDAPPRRLFWIACGTDDFLIERNRTFHDQLDRLGIQHTYVETQGAHNWNVWRDYLPTFLQLIFREQSAE